MEKREYEEKQARFMELLSQKKELEEESFKILMEMGYGTDGVPAHLNEFWDILRPAGFFVYQADKLEKEGMDTYILKVERIFPKFHSEGSSSEAAHPVCQGESRCTADSPSPCNHDS